jgi:hypothetical protein
LSLVSFRTPCSWDILRGRSIATRNTVVPMNIEVPTKYPLRQDTIVVFEIRLHSKNPMLYRPALHGNWNGLSLARRALKDKFPTPTVPLTAVLPNRQVFLPDPVQTWLVSVQYFRSLSTWNISIVKPTRCTIFRVYWISLYIYFIQNQLMHPF